MNKNIYLLLFIFSCINLSGQNNPQCGYTTFLDFQKQENPNLEEGIKATNREASQWLLSHENQKSAIILIPVVVHIIYSDQSQNISDEQIKSQIKILNRDYARLNDDRINTPAAFTAVAADSEIQFCLAEIDPDGNPTDGITRTFTTKTEIGAQGSLDYYVTANGGADIWDRDDYLNIWVCDVGDNVLGYATTPSLTTSKTKDGVVIGFEYFGSGGTTKSPNNLGRTATHEIGHWLGLEHLWGNGDPSGNNCNIDDGIADTPNQRRANYDCPNFPDTSCNNGPNGDMFMNYMDYTDDECMNMFTAGQKARMTAILNSNPRITLLNSTAGCSYTALNELSNKSNTVKISPNPSRGEISIETSLLNSEIMTVDVFDYKGQLITTQKQIPLKNSISLKFNLPNGIYSLHLKQSGNHFVEKLVIQHP